MNLLHDTWLVMQDILWPLRNAAYTFLAFLGTYLIITLCTAYFTGLAAFALAFGLFVTLGSAFIAFMEKVNKR